MSRLDPEDLVVTSFEPAPEPDFSGAQPAVVGVAADTQDRQACNSPWCGPTYWEGCEPGTA